MTDLRTALSTLPDEALVPVGWIRARLDGKADASPAGNGEPIGDLSAADVAEALDRTPSTIRAWCARGEVPGSYKLRGREWRIPRASLRRYLDRQAEGKRETRRRGEPVDLGGWRKHYRKQEAGA